MNPTAKLSAKQTAALSFSGGLIAAIGFLAVNNAHASRMHEAPIPFWAWIAVTFSLILLGFVVSIVAQSRLRKGIAAARWPVDEIESLRSLISSPLATACGWALLIGFVALAFPNTHYRNIGWACFTLNQSLSQLNFATVRRPQTTTAQHTWTKLAPIHSEHWGHR